MKDYKIKNFVICILYQLKLKFSVFHELLVLGIFLQFFISNHATSLKFFSLILRY